MRLLTAPGLAGIAVVSCHPEERPAVLAAAGIAQHDPWAVASAPAPRRAVLRLGDHDVDEVLLVPRTGGGLELHLHGSPGVLAILERHFAVVRDCAPSPADRLLRSALGPQQLWLALDQRAVAFAPALAASLLLPPGERRAALAAALVRSRQAIATVTPARVALIGRQNAGKSTLFNCLLQRERVLTGAQPGLTRDPVSEVTILDGFPYELVDTAGEGDSVEIVDRAAIDAARSQSGAALRISVIDLVTGPGESDLAAMPTATLVVGSKVDMSPSQPSFAAWPRRPDVLVSALDAEPGVLRAELGRLLRIARGLSPAGPVGGFAALDETELAQLQSCAARS